MWACPKCREKVEPNFDVCWSCGTSRTGVEDPDFGEEADTAQEPAPEPGEAVNTGRIRTIEHGPCRACGSTRIIPNVEVLDQGEGSDGHLQVVVCGDPHALIFKDRVYGKLRAWVCGSCGFTELRVRNPEELYLKSLEAREKGNA